MGKEERVCFPRGQASQIEERVVGRDMGRVERAAAIRGMDRCPKRKCQSSELERAGFNGAAERAKDGGPRGEEPEEVVG